MNKQTIIDRTMKIIMQLPEEKAKEVSDFAEFIAKQYEDQLLTNGIANLASNSKGFEFLNDEEDLYSEGDIKEPYNNVSRPLCNFVA